MITVSGKDQTAILDGPIGDYFEGGISPNEINEMLDAMGGGDFQLTIASDGGDVWQGLSIANRIRSYPGHVRIVVDGLAASIASVIAVSGDHLEMHAGSMLMIHSPWTVALGDSTEMRTVADLLDKIEYEIAGMYARKSKKKPEYYAELMAQGDYYITADEAVEIGLADSLYGEGEADPMPEEIAVAACAVFPKRNRAKLALKKRLQ